MPLITYEQTRPWAKAIRDEVLNRRMPPWGAVRGYGDLKDDHSLTQDEITRIAEWVEGGAPEGDPKYLPTSVPDPEPAPKPKPAPAARRLRTTRLTSPATVIGILPLTDIPAAKIRAERPDGSTEPLLWLKDYKQKWAHAFLLATPLRLPAGTRIIADPPARFDLLTR